MYIKCKPPSAALYTKRKNNIHNRTMKPYPVSNLITNFKENAFVVLVFVEVLVMVNMTMFHANVKQ